MGMTDGRCKLPFSKKTRAVVGPFQAASQQFQSEAAPGLQALGLINLAHASPAQQTAYAVAVPSFDRH